MTGDRDRCLEAGCDGYYTKPIDKELLLAGVHDVGGSFRRQQSMSMGRAAA